jgi:hypothetical protein
MTPEREEHRDLDLTGITAVEVATFNGMLVVECGVESPHLVAGVRGKAAYEVERIGSLLYVRAQKKGLTYADGGVRLALWLPAALRCKLANVGGDIHLHGPVARANITIVNGAIEVGNTGRADVHVSTGGAPVTVHGAEGRIILNMGNGAVDLAQVAGEIEIKSGHGPITIADAVGQIQIATGRSDMRLERITFAPGTRNWIKSGGGTTEISDISAPGGLKVHAKAIHTTRPGDKPATLDITTGGTVSIR